jgi:hypothetical protein
MPHVSIVAVMQTRSRTVEMPSGLSLPLAFGVIARSRPTISISKASSPNAWPIRMARASVQRRFGVALSAQVVPSSR